MFDPNGARDYRRSAPPRGIAKRIIPIAAAAGTRRVIHIAIRVVIKIDTSPIAAGNVCMLAVGACHVDIPGRPNFAELTVPTSDGQVVGSRRIQKRGIERCARWVSRLIPIDSVETRSIIDGITVDINIRKVIRRYANAGRRGGALRLKFKSGCRNPKCQHPRKKKTRPVPPPPFLHLRHPSTVSG